MGADPFSGTVYVFRAKRADRVKLVFWDGTGVVLVAKRLEDGEFRWPKIEDGTLQLTAAQLQACVSAWKIDPVVRGSACNFDPPLGSWSVVLLRRAGWG